MNVDEFLKSFKEWVMTEPAIEAVALAGSYARGEARIDSDVDLIIVTDLPNRYSGDNKWVGRFGNVKQITQEDYQAVQSTRVHYTDGLEVEYGIASSQWLDQNPIDPGTLKILSDGCRILVDKRGRLTALQQTVDDR